MTNNGLPNDYTPCEEYRGYVIGHRHGLYHIFTPKSRTRVFAGYVDRAAARRKIDVVLHDKN